MRPDLFYFASILSAGCASTSPNLEPRVHDLELQVAELRGEMHAQGRVDAMATRGHGVRRARTCGPQCPSPTRRR